MKCFFVFRAGYNGFKQCIKSKIKVIVRSPNSSKVAIEDTCHGGWDLKRMFHSVEGTFFKDP